MQKHMKKGRKASVSENRAQQEKELLEKTVNMLKSAGLQVFKSAVLPNKNASVKFERTFGKMVQVAFLTLFS